MAVTCRAEMSALNHEERELVRSTHHPDIGAKTRSDLQSLQSRVREMRDKEKSIARRIEREQAAERVAGAVERPYQRKQVFASALKRLNNEIRRLKAFEARGYLGELAWKALALRRSRRFPSFSAGLTSNEGVRSIPSDRRRTDVMGAKVGSVSQQTRRAQARKDKGS